MFDHDRLKEVEKITIVASMLKMLTDYTMLKMLTDYTDETIVINLTA